MQQVLPIRVQLLILGIVALFSMPALGAGPHYCVQYPGSGATGGGTVRVGGFTVEVKPDSDPGKMLCHATIRSTKGEVVFKHDDWGIDIDPVTGRDVNGDGQPDAVLVGFSGGAHCCWTYSFVSLGQEPGLITSFENRNPASFEDLKRDGRIEILVRDGTFDEFDRLPHPFSPFPLLVLHLNGDRFSDVGAEFLDTYDKEIASLRKDLNASSLNRLYRSDPAVVHDDEDYLETEFRVLLIVLDYLYSGRPQNAWKALDKMWPARDKQRIRSEMLKGYCNGLRRELGLRAGQSCKDTTSPR